MDDAGERYEAGTINSSTGLDGQKAITNIAVPADAALGSTRMRVIKNFGATSFAPDSCTGSSWGQAEDYTIVVSAGSGGGGGDTCSEENPNDGTFENGFNVSSTTAFKTANDLTVAAGENFTLTNITASIFANGGIANVDVVYYDDMGGLPGTEIGLETAVTIDSQNVIGTNFGFDVNEIELSVTPFTFDGQEGSDTTYWIELSVTDGGATGSVFWVVRSEEHTSELQSRPHLVCRLLLEKKKTKIKGVVATKYDIERTLSPPHGCRHDDRSSRGSRSPYPRRPTKYNYTTRIRTNCNLELV